MKRRCQKCGSPNHEAFDCLRPDLGWRDRLPPEPAQALPEDAPAVLTLFPPESALKQEPGGKAAVLTPKLDLDGRTTHGLSGPLPTRKSFPFLRDCTRQNIEERKRRMAGGGARGDLPAGKPDRTLPTPLPKAEKTAKQTQGTLC